MADDNTETGGKRRRPTTIDLKATEVASEPVKSSDPVEKTGEIPRAAASPDAAATAEPAQAKPNPNPKPDWLGTASWNERLASMRRDVAARLDGRLIGAGAAGAAAMFVLFLAAYAAGAFTPRDTTAPLVAQVAGLEKQLRDLANRPQPVPDPRPLTELAARVATAEQSIAKTETKVEAAAATPRPREADPALASRIAALETALRPLTDTTARIDSASAAAREAKARADAAYEAAQKTAQRAAEGASAAPSNQKEIDDLAARVAALEQATRAADARITTTAGADKAGRLAFTAAVLRATVVRGEPFGRELGAVRPLVADARLLAPLEPLAAGGVPSAAALARELSQLSSAMLATAGAPPRDGGFIDRLQQNAGRLVRIRPISEGPGDDPATVIGRAEVKATHGDLTGARADIAALPPAVQAPAQSWIARVDAREAALAAARDLAESAIGTLAKP
jgi:hypothetical protein